MAYSQEKRLDYFIGFRKKDVMSISDLEKFISTQFSQIVKTVDGQDDPIVPDDQSMRLHVNYVNIGDQLKYIDYQHRFHRNNRKSITEDIDTMGVHLTGYSSAKKASRLLYDAHIVEKLFDKLSNTVDGLVFDFSSLSWFVLKDRRLRCGKPPQLFDIYKLHTAYVGGGRVIQSMGLEKIAYPDLQWWLSQNTDISQASRILNELIANLVESGEPPTYKSIVELKSEDLTFLFERARFIANELYRKNETYQLMVNSEDAFLSEMNTDIGTNRRGYFYGE